MSSGAICSDTTAVRLFPWESMQAHSNIQTIVFGLLDETPLFLLLLFFYCRRADDVVNRANFLGSRKMVKWMRWFQSEWCRQFGRTASKEFQMEISHSAKSNCKCTEIRERHWIPADTVYAWPYQPPTNQTRMLFLLLPIKCHTHTHPALTILTVELSCTQKKE